MFTNKFLNLGYVSMIAIVLGLVISVSYVNTAQAAEEKKVELKIKGMGCEMCAKSVERVISKCAGVMGCDVNYKNGKATVEIDAKANIEEIKKAVGNTGFVYEWSSKELQ
jgi:Copper chaperone